MPYKDALNDMSNSDLTTASGAAQFGTIIDFGVAGRQIGVGTPLQARVQIDTLPVVGTTNTMTLTLETSAAADMGSSTVLATFVSAAAPPAAATQYLFTLPATGMKQYLAVKATPSATNAFTAGAFSAFMEPHIG